MARSVGPRPSSGPIYRFRRFRSRPLSALALSPPLSVQYCAFGALAVGILPREPRDWRSAPKETESGTRAVIAGGVCLASHGLGPCRVLGDATGRRWPELGAKRNVVAVCVAG